MPVTRSFYHWGYNCSLKWSCTKIWGWRRSISGSYGGMIVSLSENLDGFIQYSLSTFKIMRAALVFGDMAWHGVTWRDMTVTWALSGYNPRHCWVCSTWWHGDVSFPYIPPIPLYIPLLPVTHIYSIRKSCHHVTDYSKPKRGAGCRRDMGKKIVMSRHVTMSPKAIKKAHLFGEPT